jgi:hypothetical protein
MERNQGLAAGLAAMAIAAIGGLRDEVAYRHLTTPSLGSARGYRQGRRFSEFNRGRWPGKGNPAGTKLARKAAKGTLTVCGLR